MKWEISTARSSLKYEQKKKNKYYIYYREKKRYKYIDGALINLLNSTLINIVYCKNNTIKYNHHFQQNKLNLYIDIQTDICLIFDYILHSNANKFIKLEKNNKTHKAIRVFSFIFY